MIKPVTFIGTICAFLFFFFVVKDTCIFINDNESNIKIAFVNQSSEALLKAVHKPDPDTWTLVTATLPPQASGVTANGKITLSAKVQDAHPKVRGHFDPKDIAPFLYLLQVFWGVDTQLLSQPGLECQAIFGAPASRGLGLQACFIISLAPMGQPTFSSSILNGPQ